MSNNNKNARWLLLLWGILAILFGLVAVIMPVKTAVWLLYLIAVLILIDAVFLVFNLLRGKVHGPIKWALWIRAILGLFLGIAVVFFKPLLGSLAFGLAIVQLMGLQAIIIGVFETIYSLQHIKGKGWWPVLIGIIWVIFGLILFMWPVASLVSLTQISGIIFLSLGITYVIAGFRATPE